MNAEIAFHEDVLDQFDHDGPIYAEVIRARAYLTAGDREKLAALLEEVALADVLDPAGESPQIADAVIKAVDEYRRTPLPDVELIDLWAALKNYLHGDRSGELHRAAITDALIRIIGDAIDTPTTQTPSEVAAA